MTRVPVVVTGVGLALPGDPVPADLVRGPLPGGPPVDPAAVLGRRGLRYVDRATRFALCAVARAVADAGLPPAGEDPDRLTTGVFGATELGNVDTVCRAVAAIRSGGTGEASAMDLPNASPNVLTTTVAIRHGLGAVNVLVTNGRRSGLDALALAVTALRAGRAQRVVVLGAEPDTAEARTVLAAQERRAGRPAPAAVLDGAAAVVLEPAAVAAARSARVRAVVGPVVTAPAAAGVVAGLGRPPGTGLLWLPPDPARTPDVPDATALDPAALLGDPVAAAGVLQLATAAAWLDAHPGGGALLACGRGPVTGTVLAGRDAELPARPADLARAAP